MSAKKDDGLLTRLGNMLSDWWVRLVLAVIFCGHVGPSCRFVTTVFLMVLVRQTASNAFCIKLPLQNVLGNV